MDIRRTSVHASLARRRRPPAQSALPEWLELATARLAARHRTELSRLRGLLGGQLTALRRDLCDLRTSCSSAMAEAAQQAEETLRQVRSLR